MEDNSFDLDLLVNSVSECILKKDIELAVNMTLNNSSNSWEFNQLCFTVFSKICIKKEVELAYLYKAKLAKELINLSKKQSIDSTFQKDIALAYFYLENFEKAASYESNIVSGYSFIKFISSMLLGKKLALNELLEEKKLSVENISFSKLIKNKRVCIVGPADMGLNSGEKIDSYDVVIRTNLTANVDLKKNKLTHGSKVDVSYYNMGILNKIDFTKLVSYLNKEKVLPVFRRDYALESFYQEGGILGRYKYRLPALFCSSQTYHGIQRIILDVLAFEPKELALYNMDFYTDVSNSNRTHIASYFGKKKSSNILKTIGFEFHDPLQSFRLVKYLYKLNIIKVDTVVKRVLAWTDEEYIKHIHSKINKI